VLKMLNQTAAVEVKEIDLYEFLLATVKGGAQ
jgi:hypothetical protein